MGLRRGAGQRPSSGRRDAGLGGWPCGARPAGRHHGVVDVAPAQAAPQAAAGVAARQRAGTPRKAAIAEVARELGLHKRDVYDAVLRYGAEVPDESER